MVAGRPGPSPQRSSHEDDPRLDPSGGYFPVLRNILLYFHRFLTPRSGSIHTVCYSASPGTYILAGSADRSVRLYNPQASSPVHQAGSFVTKRETANGASAIPEGRLIQEYVAHGYEVLSLAVAADNARFASAGGDRAVFLWDVSTAKTLRRLGGNGGHSSRINCVAFAGAGDSLVVSGGFDTTVRIWDTRSGGPGAKPVQTLADARDAVTALAVRGAEVVAGSVDGRVRSYDVRAGRLTADVVGASVTSLCLTRDARALLVGSLDSRLRLMDRDTGACLRTYAAEGRWRNEELRVQSVLGGGEKFVVAGDELTAPAPAAPAAAPATTTGSPTTSPTPALAAGDGRLWAWDLLSGDLVATVSVPWGPGWNDASRRVVGRDGKEKERRNVVSCLSWRENGFGSQFCAGGTSGVVTVFGA